MRYYFYEGSRSNRAINSLVVVRSTGFFNVDVALTIVELGVRYHTSLSWQKSIFRLANGNRRLSTMKSVTQPLMPGWPGLPPTKSLPLVVSNVVSIETLTGACSSIWSVQALRRRDARMWWKTPSSTLSCNYIHAEIRVKICEKTHTHIIYIILVK